MSRFDQISSWVILAVFALALGGGLGFWWLRATVIAPSCGDVAISQLNRATEELRSRIPSLRFDGVSDSCDSGGAMWADWEAHDLRQLMSEAAAAGCRVDEPDPHDEYLYQSLTCQTTGRDAILSIELGTFPIRGDLVLS